MTGQFALRLPQYRDFGKTALASFWLDAGLRIDFLSLGLLVTAPRKETIGAEETDFSANTNERNRALNVNAANGALEHSAFGSW